MPAHPRDFSDDLLHYLKSGAFQDIPLSDEELIDVLLSHIDDYRVRQAVVEMRQRRNRFKMPPGDGPLPQQGVAITQTVVNTSDSSVKKDSKS